jgi:hypothetical protein
LLRTREAGTKLEALLEDHEEVRLYLDRELVTSSVGDLAGQALGEIPGALTTRISNIVAN